jgi:hypothetical protein
MALRLILSWWYKVEGSKLKVESWPKIYAFVILLKLFWKHQNAQHFPSRLYFYKNAFPPSRQKKFV